MELSPDCQRGAVGKVKGATPIPLKKKKTTKLHKIEESILSILLCVSAFNHQCTSISH